MWKKLNSNRGETLIESLVSVIIVSLATLLFVSLITAASNLNSRQKEADSKFYASMAKVESLAGTDRDGKERSIDVTIKNEVGITLEIIKCRVTAEGSLSAYDLVR